MVRLLCLALSLALTLAAPQVHAGMISPGDSERERVKSMLERPELAQELQKMGIAPQDARARVDAMNDAEVRQLAGRLDALPAGGAQMSNQTLLLIIIIILLIAILI